MGCSRSSVEPEVLWRLCGTCMRGPLLVPRLPHVCVCNLIDSEMAEEAIISCCGLLYGGNRRVQDVFEAQFLASPALCSTVFATIRRIIVSCGKGIKPWTARKVGAGSGVGWEEKGSSALLS